MKYIAACSIVMLVLISACVQQPPLTEITIPGHPTYTFSNDVREALQIRANDNQLIGDLIRSSKNLSIVFNGSDERDNGMFQVTLFNTITKIQTYFVYEGRILAVNSYYYIGDIWFGDVNGSRSEISKPILAGTVIWLKGPNTGATETSVILEDNIILLQGTSYKNLTLAGDKLSLIVLGIENV